MRTRSSGLAVLLFLLLSDVGRGGTLFISTTTVQATDVFSGPSFTVSGNFGPDDVVSVRGAGLVDLAVGIGDYITNVAGVVVAPQTTNKGNHPGDIGFDPAAIIPNAPLGAVLIGNNNLGFFPLFPADTSTGLGSPNPPVEITVLNRTLGAIFGSGFGGISSGTTLQLRVNDVNTVDNTGFFLISTVPEPSSLVLAVSGISAVLGVLCLRRRGRTVVA